MFAYDTLNYSLRPNKAIQRQLAFEGLEILARHMPVAAAKYIGFGSVWFADFSMAHKRLGIQDMLSIEKDPILYSRAKFNAPFRTVQVEEGDSNTVLKTLLVDEVAMSKPWIVWLDYTSSLTPEVMEDIDLVTDRAPPNSVILVTINAMAKNYGTGLDGRRNLIKDRFGDAVSDDLAPERFEKGNLPETVADCGLRYIDSRCKSFGRKPGFIPAFKMPYRDSAHMVTFGGVLPALGQEKQIEVDVAAPTWPGFPAVPIETPPLTAKETQALLRLLPSVQDLTRADVQGTGFDLEDDKLKVYCAHYRRYPSFFQVAG
jgi:hypothetical protein